MRSREKGDSLFTMIPLERWNVERRSTDSSKSTGNWVQPIPYDLLFATRNGS